MPFFIPSHVADNITLSLMILAGVTVARWAVEWAVTGRCDPLAARRRRFTIRAVCNAAIAVALLGIWLSEIQNIMFSLAAVMVALVVATKELLMCVAGSVLRFGGHLFKVGDRIELTGIHGEVIDHGLFSTTIMELPAHHLGHAGTGRMVMLPNSILLTGPVRVEPQPRQYAPHRFTLTMETPVPARQVVDLIHAAAQEALAGDLERATRFHRLTAGKAGADIAGPGHEVAVATSDIGKLQFHVMIYCLVKDARALEQAILIDMLEKLPLGERIPRPAEAKAWAEIARQLREGSGGRREAAA
ncbi:mechanosensitive ion channel family protein [Aurantimonas sp. HBX-1]|uniref:mechanosensitive ion channel family protein n=1 Tax=Aurantimonas sp. HBX-1 TaxID=2906072 RepID=UPI001F31E362|nr:mechanosensitive ion channel family protein [Aurantimonas sp. HBX-1]UIJ71896.1 mechanosensitive ion channel family protein [Aurantimonas sp. HBX-1]